ncbi:MAG: M48 family metallopeptidase [Alistipes sp.]|jgi:predicted metal-dependent hydrolase|nr:M48 family metallopeptidase [Alistipes sp.]
MQKKIIYPGVGPVTLSRTRRSTRLSLSVKPDGAVRLSFPTWVTQKGALAFLDEKREWIADTRRKLAEKYPSHSPAPLNEAERAAAAKAEKLRIEALRAEAKNILPPMVARLAAEHGFRYGAVRVKATKSRWGSCTVRNDINLSIFLVTLPGHLVEYIVLHELCHTVHKNHSERFHGLLDSVTGGRDKLLRRELKAYRPTPPAN